MLLSNLNFWKLLFLSLLLINIGLQQFSYSQGFPSGGNGAGVKSDKEFSFVPFPYLPFQG
ncbi:MAG: hypothetical protein KTR26_08905 [Flammeovirgaceae bacterium]|nr:hypothetical protein [Flammeovirgaceae bacterium]